MSDKKLVIGETKVGTVRNTSNRGHIKIEEDDAGLKNHETNIEFLSRIMDFSRSGALMQLFIMDAIGKRAKTITETPIEDLRAAFGENSFIHPDAWHACAKELQDEYNKHLK